jgi:putative spermidine/putrescine transport system substrate-binding protein
LVPAYLKSTTFATKPKKIWASSIEMRALSTEENNQIAITQPGQYDIFDGEYFSLPLVVPSGNFQPIDISRITNYDKIVSFFRTGEFKGMPVEHVPGYGPLQGACT